MEPKIEIFGPRENVPCISNETSSTIQAILDEISNETREFQIETDGTVVFFIDNIPTDKYEPLLNEVRKVLDDDSLDVEIGMHDDIAAILISRPTI
jgi:hypothetical protein